MTDDDRKPKRPDDPRRAYGPGETPPELAKLLLHELDRLSAGLDYDPPEEGQDIKRPDRSPEAVAHRRQLLRAAMHESEMEGVRARDPDAAFIEKAYVAGDMTTAEVIAALDAHYKPQPAQRAAETGAGPGRCHGAGAIPIST